MLISTVDAVPFEYITNIGSNNISVIDTATNTIVTNVSIGSVPSGVAVSPDGLKVYVPNWDSDNVSVIDTVTNTVEPTAILVGIFPEGVASLQMEKQYM